MKVSHKENLIPFRHLHFKDIFPVVLQVHYQSRQKCDKNTALNREESLSKGPKFLLAYQTTVHLQCYLEHLTSINVRLQWQISILYITEKPFHSKTAILVLNDCHKMSAIRGHQWEILRSRFTPLSALMALSAEPLNFTADFGVIQR